MDLPRVLLRRISLLWRETSVCGAAVSRSLTEDLGSRPAPRLRWRDISAELAKMHLHVIPCRSGVHAVKLVGRGLNHREEASRDGRDGRQPKVCTGQKGGKLLL
jgi:hypothetical protein